MNTNTNHKQGRIWRWLVAAVMVAVLGATGVARADGEPAAGEVVTVDVAQPVGESAGPGSPTPQTQLPSPGNYRLYLSTPGSGSIGNISYADEDVLSYKPSTGQWVKTFDGTNAGLPAAADIDAFAYHYQSPVSYLYMSFDTPVAVPGLGTVDDSDVVVYAVTLGSSSWSMVLDGSAVGLTTDGEDIDGLERAAEGEYLISTTGNFSVPGHYQTTVKGDDADWLRLVNGKFYIQMSGETLGVAATNDVVALAYEYSGLGDNYYAVTQRKYSYEGETVAAGNVWVYTSGNYDMTDAGLFWARQAVGKIDAFDLRLEP